MIEKPDPSDFVLWRRSACTQWLLEQVAARFNHSADWMTARSLEDLAKMCGNQEVINFIQAET